MGLPWQSGDQDSALPTQGLNPWLGNKIPHAARHGQKQKKENNSKWIKGLSERQNIKLLRDNIVENLDDVRYSDDFLDTISKTQCMIEITDKLYFIKFKSFAVQKTKSKRVR